MISNNSLDRLIDHREIAKILRLPLSTVISRSNHGLFIKPDMRVGSSHRKLFKLSRILEYKKHRNAYEIAKRKRGCIRYSTSFRFDEKVKEMVYGLFRDGQMKNKSLGMELLIRYINHVENRDRFIRFLRSKSSYE